MNQLLNRLTATFKLKAREHLPKPMALLLDSSKKKKRGRVPWNDLERLPGYIVKSKKAKCKRVSIACCLSCEKEESIRIYMGLLTSARNTGRMNPKTNI